MAKVAVVNDDVCRLWDCVRADRDLATLEACFERFLEAVEQTPKSRARSALVK